MRLGIGVGVELRRPVRPGKVLAAAYQATSGAHTARVQIRTRLDANGAGASVNTSSAADGVIDFSNGTRQIVTQQPTGGQTESRLVGGVLYTQVPAALAGQPGQKPWLKITLPAGSASGTQDDPTQALSYLRGAARSIRKVGTEKVRDAQTTHYTAEIDLARLAAQATPSPAAGQPDPSTLLRRLLGRDTLPIEIWVDDQQRVRRLQTTLPVQQFSGTATATPSAAPGAPVPPSASADAPPATPSAAGTPKTSGVATSTEEFYDFGVAVDVQPPPADQVQDGPVVRVPASPAVPPSAPPSATGTSS